MKRIALIITILLLFPTIVNGYECSNTDRENLKKLSNNIVYTIEDYTEDDGTTKFRINFTGLSNKTLLADERYGLRYTSPSSEFGEISLDGFLMGVTYRFSIYGVDDCFNTKVRNITLTFPYYNNFYNDKLCLNAKEYKLCQKWVEKQYDYQTFKELMQKYIESIKDEKTINEDKSNSWDLFYAIYKKYYWPSLITLVIVLGILIFLWIKGNNKNKL